MNKEKLIERLKKKHESMTIHYVYFMEEIAGLMMTGCKFDKIFSFEEWLRILKVTFIEWLCKQPPIFEIKGKFVPSTPTHYKKIMIYRDNLLDKLDPDWAHKSRYIELLRKNKY